eukprot:8838123-Pyramimonas_sp.AAC.1
MSDAPQDEVHEVEAPGPQTAEAGTPAPGDCPAIATQECPTPQAEVATESQVDGEAAESASDLQQAD